MSDCNSEYQDIVISTFIIISSEESKSFSLIKEQFAGRSEFDINYVKKIHPVIDFDLLKFIVEKAVEEADDVIIICNDSHRFTEFYSKNYLLKNIIEANAQGCAILSGGSDFGFAVPLTENRLWISSLSSIQFIVLYRKIFKRILNFRLKKGDTLDSELSSLSSHKMILHPFISTQDAASNIFPNVSEVNVDQLRMANSRLEKIRNSYLKYIK